MDYLGLLHKPDVREAYGMCSATLEQAKTLKVVPFNNLLHILSAHSKEQLLMACLNSSRRKITTVW